MPFRTSPSENNKMVDTSNFYHITNITMTLKKEVQQLLKIHVGYHGCQKTQKKKKIIILGWLTTVIGLCVTSECYLNKYFYLWG